MCIFIFISRKRERKRGERKREREREKKNDKKKGRGERKLRAVFLYFMCGYIYILYIYIVYNRTERKKMDGKGARGSSLAFLIEHLFLSRCLCVVKRGIT